MCFFLFAIKYSFSVDNFFESNILQRKKNPSSFMLIFVNFLKRDKMQINRLIKILLDVIVIAN